MTFRIRWRRHTPGVPLQDRRKGLAQLLRKPKGKAAQTIASGIVLSEAIEAKGEAMFRHACRMGLEGIVSKRLGSPYVSGRTRHWLKTKIRSSSASTNTVWCAGHSSLTSTQSAYFRLRRYAAPA